MNMQTIYKELLNLPELRDIPAKYVVIVYVSTIQLLNDYNLIRIKGEHNDDELL